MKKIKTVMIIALLSISGLGFAQQLNDNIKKAFKADDATALLAEIKNQKVTINDCFNIEDISYSLLSLSIKMNKPKIFNQLIEQKADVNKICDEKSPLMYTAKYGLLDFAKALVKAGADISAESATGKTAYDYAVKYEKTALQPLLKPVK